MSDDPASNRSQAEGVYIDPADTLTAARAVLATPGVSAGERADALLAVGRSAYYANQMTEAVGLLREGADLADDPDTLIEILLTLAPALSKQGAPDEALGLLDPAARRIGPHHGGQLHNQRGIILAELGRLPESKAEMLQALALLREAGDGNRETRTMVNLGATTSLMGQLDEAEEWYTQALERSHADGQKVVAAGIAGNLGDLASRRGNFGEALRWYDDARASFDGLGDVELLVSVLELDHARTLLDVGLVVDAVDAAERAARSAELGNNQMLETQANTVLGEALLRLGERANADAALAHGRALAERLGQEPWALRAEFLASGAGSRLDGDVEGTRNGIQRFLAVGWVREAYEFALNQAAALWVDEPERARDALGEIESLTSDLHVDGVDRARASLLAAAIDADLDAGMAAFDDALVALDDQRDLLGSVELRTVLSHRAEPIIDAAMALALGAPDPGVLALDVIERVRAVRATSALARQRHGSSERLAQLRTSRVLLDEAKLDGRNVDEAAADVARLEREILRRRRSDVAGPGRIPMAQAANDVELPDDTTYITHAVHRGRVLGLVRKADAAEIVELGPLDGVIPVVRAQRQALRRLADERVVDTDRYRAALHQTSAALSQMLIEALPVAMSDRVVITPATRMRDVAWGALPALRDRPVTLAHGLAGWDADRAPLEARRVGLLQGPGLARSGDELDAVAQLWREPDALVRNCSCAQAVEMLATADLVHIAAHGAFRSDNPFFSSVRFADGLLSILEMSELPRLPTVVVLASCDAAAAASIGGDAGVVVGTASELRSLGTRIVVAPSVPVNDDAVADLSIRLHQGLVAGRSFDHAVLDARNALAASDNPRRIAAAAAMQVFGGRATRERIVGPLTD
ncbi:MAG: CHAT domain-containing protein [Actinomycetota bacterium]